MTKNPATIKDLDSHHERARNLGLHGLLAHWDEVQNQDWVPWVLEECGAPHSEERFILLWRSHDG